MENGDTPWPWAGAIQRMSEKFDVVIVGAGPAGVSCGVWLEQLGYRTALVDKNARCGGLQLQNPWTNTWIATSGKSTGAEVAHQLHQSALAHGCSLFLPAEARSCSTHAGAWQVNLSTGATISARALVLAGGVVPASGGFVSRAKLLVGPGEKVARTDFRGARVAILGGGDSAFENHQLIRQRGASVVHIYARSVRARAEQLERVPAADVFVGEYEADPDSGSVAGQTYDQILVLYGYEANKLALLGLEPALQPKGFVQTDPDCRTSIPGVWAIGELANRAHPCCVTAMADGVVAAKSIQRALEASTAAKYLGAVRRAASFASKVVRP